MKIKAEKILKGDIFIIICVLILSLFVFILTLPKSSSQSFAEIYVDGKLLHNIELVENSTSKIKIYNFATVEIEGKKLRVVDSICNDHLCESGGYIEKTGEVIVCMPNKLLIKIVGAKENHDFDGVVG